MRRTCDWAPVQYEGTIDGRPFYFRARHNGWFFRVANTLDEAIDQPGEVGMLPDGGYCRESTWGRDPEDASYMPYEDAERIIRTCAEEYIAGRDARHQRDTNMYEP